MECCRFVCSSEEQRSVTLALNRPAGASRRPRYLRAISRDWQLLSPGTKLVQKTEITADRWRITGDKKQHQPCRHGDSSESHSGWKQKFLCKEFKRKQQRKLRCLICSELKSVSASRRREKLRVATVTCRSDQTWGSGNFSAEHFDNFQEEAAAAHQSRGAHFMSGNPSEQILDLPAEPRPRQEAGRRLADPRDAFCAVLWSVLYRVLFNKNANFFSWPFCSCWFVSMKVVSMTTDALIKGNKVWAFN